MTKANHMPIDKTCPSDCGLNKKTCESECYPIYDPNNTTDGVFQLMQLTLRDIANGSPDLVQTPIGQKPPIDTRVPYDRNDPLTPKRNENEIDSFVLNQLAVKIGRKDGIFRSSKAPYKWFTWEINDAARMALNKFDPNIHMRLASIGIQLSAIEVMALAKCKELQLGRSDLACKDGFCPVEMEDGKLTDGTYLFTGDSARIGEMIAVLENENITIDITPERRLKLTEHLSALKAVADEPGDQWWKSAILGAVAALFTLGGLFLYLNGRTERKADRRQVELLDGRKVENPLERYGRNITEAAKNGELDPFIGGEGIFQEILEIVGRRKKPNPLLEGPSGVGKTSVIEGLVQALVKGEISIRRKQLENAELWEISLNRLEADNTENRGGFEKNWQALIDQVVLFRKGGRNIWLVIDEAHHMVSAGSASKTPGLSEKAKIDLIKSGIPIIALTDRPEEIKRDAALMRRFTPVTVPEPTLPEVIRIILGRIGIEERYYQITISPDVASIIADKAPPIIDAQGRNLSNPGRAIEAFDALLGWFSNKFGSGVELKPEHVDQWLQERPPQPVANGPEFDPLALLRGGLPLTIEDLLERSIVGGPVPADMSPEAAARLREAEEGARKALKDLKEARRAIRKAEETVGKSRK